MRFTSIYFHTVIPNGSLFPLGTFSKKETLCLRVLHRQLRRDNLLQRRKAYFYSYPIRPNGSCFLKSFCESETFGYSILQDAYKGSRFKLFLKSASSGTLAV